MKKNKNGDSPENQQKIFTERFNKELEKSGKSAKELFTNIIPLSSISKYKNGLSMPSQTSLKHIANVLGVSVQYLTGEAEVPSYAFEDINKKTGLAQKAIENLYKIKHNYFVFEDDVDVDITEEHNISNVYSDELIILSSILEDSSLLLLLTNIKEYKETCKLLHSLKKIYKETKDKNVFLKIVDTESKVKTLKFFVIDYFNNILESLNK